MGPTDYLDFIELSEYDTMGSIMKGKDKYKRSFVTLKTRIDEKPFNQCIF
jgi:hypothetical protein